jgi:hypothetical protein
MIDLVSTIDDRSPEIILSVRGMLNNVREQEIVIGVETGEGALIAVSRRFAGKRQRVQGITRSILR